MTQPPDTVASPAAQKFLRFHLMADVGPIRLRKLCEHFGNMDAVLGASRAELERVDGIGPKLSQTIFAARGNEAAAAQEIERAAAAGLRILCPDDPDYPATLRHIPDPPICLYLRGTLQPQDAVAVAIVGTRRCSHYGREQAVRFAELLARAGFTVVSGLARGIDGHAHRGALQVGGRTLAVLGNGLPAIYPTEHETLAADIAAAGALISEYPIDTAPAADNFPRRNRIIAGLSLGVIVIEAGKQSGALITARLATEYNREVFALPGRVDQPAMSEGVNRLIRDGQAKLITSLDDVLDELSAVGEIMRSAAHAPRTVIRRAQDRPTDAASSLFDAPAAAPAVQPTSLPLSDDERAVLDALARGAEDIDGLIESSGLEVARLIGLLTTLELKSLIRRLPGNRYAPRSSPTKAD